MSIRKRGQKYEVRWHEGGRKRSRAFERAGDAEAFELEAKRRKQLGPLASGVIQSRQTLAEFVERDWWPRYAIPNLAPDTRRRYLEIWGTHLLPRVGDYEIREITPLVVEDMIAAMVRARVPAPTQRKAVMLLQGMLRRAVVHGLIPANPVQQVAKPKQLSTEAANPLSPEQVERIRLYMLTRSWSSEKRGTGRSRWSLEWWRQRNALVVSLLAYAGFRPSEDRSLVWSDLRGNVLHVVATKTNRPRQVDVLEPLAKELAQWQLLCGRPTGRQLIIPRTVSGPWTKNDWDNWRERVYRPAAKSVLGPDAEGRHPYRPYRLRSSYVSLLLWAGEDLPYVADQAGHSVATLARHYAGVLRELRRKPRVPAAAAIREARASVGTELTGLLASSDRVPSGTQIGRNAEAEG